MLKKQLQKDIDFLLYDKEYHQKINALEPFLDKFKHKVFDIFEKKKCCRPSPYKLDEIRAFEQANDITLPYQLRYYLTNISKVIIGNCGYPTSFFIYHEHEDTFDKLEDLYSYPSVHPLNKYLPDNYETFLPSNKNDVKYCAKVCYVDELEYNNLTLIDDNDWKLPIEIEDEEYVFYQDFMSKFCDECNYWILLGDTYYTEMFDEDVDYCSKCYQKLKESDNLVLEDKKFYKHKAKFLINLPADCMKCEEKKLKSYYVIPDIFDDVFHTKNDGKPFFNNKYCCLNCIDNLKEELSIAEKTYNMVIIDKIFRIDILKKSFQKGIMKIQERGCGLKISIILNGKYRGCIEGKYLYNDTNCNQYNYLLESLFDYIFMKEFGKTELVDNLYITKFFFKEYKNYARAILENLDDSTFDISDYE